MSDLPDSENPFKRPSIYALLGVDPFAGTAEIEAALEKVKSQLKKADAKQAEVLEKQISRLKDPATRLQLNSLEFDRIDAKALRQRLSSLPSLAAIDPKLPELGMAQVLKEGQSLETVQSDCQDISADESMLLDFDSVHKALSQPGADNHIHFDS
jgi:hypothetical protein